MSNFTEKKKKILFYQCLKEENKELKFLIENEKYKEIIIMLPSKGLKVQMLYVILLFFIKMVL